MRKTPEELEQIKIKLGTDRLWSWSRKNCVHNSLYEYFLKYIKNKPEDRTDSIYVVTGGFSHDIIERFYSNQLKKEELPEEFECAWTIAFDVDGLKFDRNDAEKNKSIADKYYKDLQHFFKNHNEITSDILLEQFVTVKVGDEYFQGYIDALTTDMNGNYVIIDWKTSTLYVGEKAKNESGQLVLYAMALHQKGIPYEKISICWNFLKYANIYCDKNEYIKLSWTTANGEKKQKDKLDKSKLASTLKASVKALLKADGMSNDQIEILIDQMMETNSINCLSDQIKSKIIIEDIIVENKPRQIERVKIGETLQANVKAQMKKLGYAEDEIFTTLNQLLLTNDLNCLPENVRDKYRMEDCYVYVDLTKELIEYWEKDIIETLKMIRDKESEYEKTKDESIWMESQEKVKENSFYFANLCGYSANIHKPYKIYLQSLEENKKDDVFLNSDNDEYDIDDLSWIENL